MPDTQISTLTATVSSLFGIPFPTLAKTPPIRQVIENARRSLRGKPVDKCLIFAPDALGAHLEEKCEMEFAKIRRICPLEIPLLSMFPSKTPVCFASMFTGAAPQKHGIMQYEKPVLKCDTLFDAMIRAGRNPAIVAVRDSSMDVIFRQRKMLFFSENHDTDTTSRTKQLLHANRMDLIVCYQQEYDDCLHRTQPFSREALQAVSNHIHSFLELAAAARKAWSAYNYVLIVAPDHGAHTDPVSGRGTHGDDIAEDMDLHHWYGIVPEQR